jgi:hypothetical protein
MAKSLQYQILSRATELTTDRRDWFRSYYCKTGRGKEVKPWEHGAARFCAHAAMGRAYYELTVEILRFPWVKGIRPSQLAKLEGINDMQGHEAVFTGDG